MHGLDKGKHTKAACVSSRTACLPTAVTDFLQEHLQKNRRNINIYYTEATDKREFSRYINRMWQKKTDSAELLWTYCKSISCSIWRTWTRVGGQGEMERKSLAPTGWNPQASLCQSWQGNLQRCKPSLGVRLAVSKLLWELRAGILEQAIPLCLSFCLSVLNSPSALIHSHIQFPALSIHQSPHFVSADFIQAHNHIVAMARPRGTTPPPMPTATSRFQTAICWRRAQPAACRFLLHRPAKTLILNLIPIGLLFTFPTEENGREKDTRREKQGGGGEWGGAG